MSPVHFDIATENLADALDRFSEQSGLQVVYDQSLLEGQRAPAVTGVMSVSAALDRLLSRSELVWGYVNANTVVLRRKPPPGPADTRATSSKKNRPASEVVDLGRYETLGVGDDPVGLLPNEPVDSVFGFSKSLLETPRSISVLTDDMMAFYGIESALDVAKVVPGTYTASIFSINGNVNIRSVASDTYFRGVKRLENTQLFPSPITAMSRVDVVRGPPSPIYGPGKIGGYTNFVPKSARAATGKLLEKPTGKLVATAGSYEKRAASGEVGGPFSLRGRRGGYYLYVSADNSNTFYNNVPFEQYIVQSSFDLEIADRVRTEVGHMFQRWNGTELAGWNRITQELIDTGVYNAGQVQVNMDLNGDGLIATAEVDTFGPLLRDFSLGTDAATVSAALGPGWSIDPSTVREVKLSRKANAQSSEDGGQATVQLAYCDIFFELPDGATLVNKTYFETMDRFKWTRASAFGQDTGSSVVEEKLVYENAFTPLAAAWGLRFAASALIRHYDTRTLSGTKYSDLVNRADLSRPFSELNRFAVPNLEPELAPWNTGLKSTYTTKGIGALIDAQYEDSNLLLGARYDHVHVHSRIPAFVLTTPGLEASDSDSGLSWSISVSREITEGIRPYATYARQETLVHGIDGGVGVAAVPHALNTSELREVGIKAGLLDNKAFIALSAYRQTRTSFTTDTLQVPATRSRGVELEARWVPAERVSLAAGGNWQTTVYDPVRTGPVMVSPAYFGLPNDYYGGRLQAVLTSDPEYAERTGYPDVMFNLNGTYFFNKSWAFNVSLVYQGEAASGRLRNITLPDATIMDVAWIYDTPKWGARVSVNNVTDALYFTPNSPDFTGELIVIPAPGRNLLTSFSYKF